MHVNKVLTGTKTDTKDEQYNPKDKHIH